MTTVLIGLTGPIGCGKSTIAGWLAEAGAVVIDGDEVARRVTDPDGPAYAAVVERFGPGVVSPHGSIDRAALAAIVFDDDAALRALEEIVHPAVRPRIEAAIANAEREGAAAVVIEAIKLVEGGLAALCDEVWLVTCDQGAQRGRLASRAMDPADLERRIAAQEGLVSRLAPAATRILETSDSPDRTRERVLAAFAEAIA